jgi:hypothetical protein
MDANSVRNMYSIIAVTNKHTAKLHHVGSLYILTRNTWKYQAECMCEYYTHISDIEDSSTPACTSLHFTFNTLEYGKAIQ